MIRSSKPSSLVCPLATICGSKTPLRSPGIARSLSPLARYRELDRAVVAEHRFARMAVAVVSAASAGRVALLVPQMLAQLGTQCALQQFLLELFEEPLFTEQILRGAISLQQLLDHLVSDRLCHVRDPLYHIECLTARTYTRYRTPSGPSFRV